MQHLHKTRGGVAAPLAATAATLAVGMSPGTTVGMEDQSDRSACMTSTRAARAAGSADATTAAASSMTAEPITGRALGMRTSRK